MLNSRLFHAVSTRFFYAFACAHLTSGNQALGGVRWFSFLITRINKWSITPDQIPHQGNSAVNFRKKMLTCKINCIRGVGCGKMHVKLLLRLGYSREGLGANNFCLF